jgi:hypothetical protein
MLIKILIEEETIPDMIQVDRRDVTTFYYHFCCT